jgi:hypothetical protein
VQPVLLAPILQRVEIGHEHFPSSIVVISSANPAFPEVRLAPRVLVRRAKGRRCRPGAPLVRKQNRVHAVAETGTCQRNTRKCRPQREHRQGWRIRCRVRSMTFRMPTVRKSTDLQCGHCARNSSSPAPIMIKSLLSSRLGEQRVVRVGLQQHARASASCFLKC